MSRSIRLKKIPTIRKDDSETLVMKALYDFLTATNMFK